MLDAVRAGHALDVNGLFHEICFLSVGGRFCRSFGDGWRRYVRRAVDGGDTRCGGDCLRALCRLLRDGEKAQAQGIQHDADARQAHRRRPDHGRELDAERGVEHARRERDADDVVEERPEEVLLDVAHDTARQADRTDRVEEVAPHEDGVRTLDGDIRARADGDAEIRLHEGGRIIHTVTDHGNTVSIGLQPLDVLLLILWQDASNNLRDAELIGNRARRACVVAREHDGGEPHRLHLGDRRRARRLFRVADAEEPDDLSRTDDDECRLAAPRHLGTYRLDGGRQGDAELCEERRIARRAVRTVHAGAYALAEYRVKVRRGGDALPLRRRVCRDRRRDGVLAARLKGSGERRQLVCGDTDGADARELRTPLGERPRLVHEDGVDAARRLKCRARLDEDAVRRPASRTDHDRDGGREPERTWAGDDENGDRDGERELKARAHHQPDAARREREHDDHGDEYPCDTIRQTCDRCL